MRVYLFSVVSKALATYLNLSGLVANQQFCLVPFFFPKHQFLDLKRKLALPLCGKRYWFSVGLAAQTHSKFLKFPSKEYFIQVCSKGPVMGGYTLLASIQGYVLEPVNNQGWRGNAWYGVGFLLPKHAFWTNQNVQQIRDHTTTTNPFSFVKPFSRNVYLSFLTFRNSKKWRI